MFVTAFCIEPVPALPTSKPFSPIGAGTLSQHGRSENIGRDQLAPRIMRPVTHSTPPVLPPTLAGLSLSAPIHRSRDSIVHRPPFFQPSVQRRYRDAIVSSYQKRRAAVSHFQTSELGLHRSAPFEENPATKSSGGASIETMGGSI